MAKTTSLAIVFADVSGSTQLFDTLGDDKAWNIVQQCLDVLKEEIERHSGTLIKTIGDEIMCTFPSADAAVDAAIRMQERVGEDLPGTVEGKPSTLTIRVGLHYGQVIPKDGDVFGDAVNLAARMAAAAKGSQIITTRQTVELLSSNLADLTRHVDRMPIKGKSAHIDIYEVLWEEEGATRMATHINPDQIQKAKLTLRYGGKELVLDQDSNPIVLGRGSSAELRVNDDDASRVHLRIECARGKFVVTDDSVNGTYLETPQGVVYLRRKETHTITGKGMISLGRELGDNPELVSYECDS